MLINPCFGTLYSIGTHHRNLLKSLVSPMSSVTHFILKAHMWKPKTHEPKTNGLLNTDGTCLYIIIRKIKLKKGSGLTGWWLYCWLDWVLRESDKVTVTPSLPQLVNFLGWKVHTDMPANSIFDGPITNLLSILCVWIEILWCAHAKRGGALTISNLALLLVIFRVTVWLTQQWRG